MAAIVGLPLVIPAGASTPAARAYVEAILARVPVPGGAVRAHSLSVHIEDSSGNVPLGVSGLLYARRDYALPVNIDVSSYIQAHPVPGSSFRGIGSEGGPGWSVSSASGYLSCANRHVVECGYYYVYGTVGGRQELEVGAYVTWRPIVVVRMPTAGVATLTGFGTTSLLRPSSHPASARLSAPERAAIATGIVGLKDSDGGRCEEDSELFTLTIRSSLHGAVLWRATADGCPGVLSITWGRHHASLDARSCALDRAVLAALSPRASATARALSACQRGGSAQ
ncbi:MAG TPA: hypothetical protein VGS61_00475 [Acidimicrobiales bacterium]|nr:hypothetical protein [Acidimicrobiales bacterium]